LNNLIFDYEKLCIFVEKLIFMVFVLKENEVTRDNLLAILEKLGKKKNPRGKSLAKHFGKLKWDVDGVEYQKIVRSEWD